MIIVAGEALVDLLVPPDGRLSAVPGGGPYNTARTIGRLGGHVAFLGRLSTDRFGVRLRQGLEADGVDLVWSAPCEEPTTLALAELDDAGAATYRFYLAETSAAGLGIDEVTTAFAARPQAVHVGTLALVAEPMASAIAVGLGRLDPSVVVMVDPNCRPSVIRDRVAYLDRLRSILARADVVKVSTEDLAYLEPGRSHEAGAGALLGLGARVVLLTDGARPVGVCLHGSVFEVSVPAVEVVDTVGAGDAFGGAFLARSMEIGGGRRGLGDAEVVREAVERAVEVAALTCQRRGADPPRRDEVAWPPD